LPSRQACVPGDVRLSLPAAAFRGPTYTDKEAVDGKAQEGRAGGSRAPRSDHATRPARIRSGLERGAAGAGCRWSSASAVRSVAPSAAHGRAASGAVAGDWAARPRGGLNPTIEDEWVPPRTTPTVRMRKSASRTRPIGRPMSTAAGAMMHADADWAEIEPNLAAGWPQARGDSTLRVDRRAARGQGRVGPSRPPIGSAKKL